MTLQEAHDQLDQDNVTDGRARFQSAADVKLRSFIERVERLEAEKAELAEDIREVYGEAKANGYDPKIMRKIVRLRKMDADKRQEEEALVEVYSNAVGLS